MIIFNFLRFSWFFRNNNIICACRTSSSLIYGTSSGICGNSSFTCCAFRCASGTFSCICRTFRRTSGTFSCICRTFRRASGTFSCICGNSSCTCRTFRCACGSFNCISCIFSLLKYSMSSITHI